MGFFGGFLKNVCGSAGIMFAAAAVPLMLGAGIAIDMVRLSQSRTVLQAAADAAAIAGATTDGMSQTDLNKVVKAYLVANGAEDALSNVTSMKNWTDTTNATFNVKIEGTLNTSLMKMAGVASVDISVDSQVNLGQQSLELALVLDNTGSMAGLKIETLRNAAKELVRIINGAKSEYSSLKVALVPFSEYVNVGPVNAGAGWLSFAAPIAGWEGCVGSRNNPLDEVASFAIGQEYPALAAARCIAPILPLTSSISTINARIDAMTAEGNTYVPGGLLWGWNVLSSDAPFSEGMTDAQLKEKNGLKVIVLMTDGTNTLSPTYPLHEVGNISRADNKLRDICRNVKDENYVVYTVSFMIADANIVQLMKNCASEHAKAFDADNPAQLYAAFQNIGQSLAAVRITR